MLWLDRVNNHDMLDLQKFRWLNEFDGDHLYGLYDIVTQRFIYVHSHFDYLKLVALLFSSRYRLYPCQIDCADNYTPTIIDNDVVTAWGIKYHNAYESSMSSTFNTVKTVYQVKSLIELSPLDDDEIILKDIPYMHYLQGVLTELNELVGISHMGGGFDPDVDLSAAQFLDLPFEHPMSHIIFKEILKVFHEEYDFEIAKGKIRHAFSKATTF